MTRTLLLTSSALALLWCAAPTSAQAQQKGGEEKSAPSGMPSGKATGGEQRVQREPSGAAEKSGEPAQQKAEPQSEKGTAQGEGKGPPRKGTAEKAPRDQGTKGATQSEPKDKTSKGASQSDRPSKSTPEKEGERPTKGTAQSPSKEQGKGSSAQTQPKDSGTKQAEPRDKTGGSAGPRVQLSDQQRTNVSQTILKDSRVNRATNVNFSVSVGTKVPRSVRLVALPATVISIVPEYRSYRYFVVEEQLCIVDPNTYEIVEVITISKQTAGRGGPATLVLTDEERMIILREVDMRGGSTLALGALTEGADVPRGAQVQTFSAAVVEKVPKVKGYKFFTAENRLAIVDPEGSKVKLVIEERR